MGFKTLTEGSLRPQRRVPRANVVDDIFGEVRHIGLPKHWLDRFENYFRLNLATDSDEKLQP
jgi:hypothetical protein